MRPINVTAITDAKVMDAPTISSIVKGLLSIMELKMRAATGVSNSIEEASDGWIMLRALNQSRKPMTWASKASRNSRRRDSIVI